MQLSGTTDLRPWLLANRATAFDELQAAGHRVHADIWLEKLELRLDLSNVAVPVVNALDISSLVAAVSETTRNYPPPCQRGKSLNP